MRGLGAADLAELTQPYRRKLACGDGALFPLETIPIIAFESEKVYRVCLKDSIIFMIIMSPQEKRLTSWPVLTENHTTYPSAKRSQSVKETAERLQLQHRNLWEDFTPIYKSINSSYTMAHSNTATFPVVMIKIKSTDRLQESKPKITTASHKNIVCLLATFYHEEQLYFVYEPCIVTLADILSTPRGRLEIYELAVICEQLLRGLQFIHQDLEISYGDLDSNDILLNREGRVKLGIMQILVYVLLGLHCRQSG